MAGIRTDVTRGLIDVDAALRQTAPHTHQAEYRYGTSDMSAPTSGSAGGSPTPGFYPDPSIPGYIRYWNGAAWVPGTSRPAPAEGEAMPAPPPGAVLAPAPSVEETGPVFLDEDTGGAAPAVRQGGEVAGAAAASWDDPARLHGTSPEPASAWQADASRQSGFGGVSWGSPDSGAPSGAASWGAAPGEQQPEGAADVPGTASSATPAPRHPEAPADGTVAIRAVKPGRGSGDQGTTAIRAVKPGRAAPADQGTTAFRAVRPDQGGAGEAGAPAKGNETMAFRLPPRGAGGPSAAPSNAAPQDLPSVGGRTPGVPQQGAPQQGAPAAQPPGPQGIPGQGLPPQAGPQGGPQAAAPQPGFPLQGGAVPGADGVIPWKPPAADVFFAAAQAAEGRPAELGRRLGARLIDSAVVGALTAAAAVPLWGSVTDHIDAKVEAAKQSGREVTVYLLDGTTTPIFAVILAVLLVGGGLYEVLPTLKWGRTLGKKVCGLRLLDIESHDTPGVAAVIKRWLCYSVLGLVAVGVVNAVWCVFDKPWRQCWHDKLARTFVAADATESAD